MNFKQTLEGRLILRSFLTSPAMKFGSFVSRSLSWLWRLIFGDWAQINGLRAGDQSRCLHIQLQPHCRGRWFSHCTLPHFSLMEFLASYRLLRMGMHAFISFAHDLRTSLLGNSTSVRERLKMSCFYQPGEESP